LLEHRALEVRKRLKFSGMPPATLGDATALNARAQRRKVEGFDGAVVGERYVFRLWRMN
jgi:hypothetical protein